MINGCGSDRNLTLGRRVCNKSILKMAQDLNTISNKPVFGPAQEHELLECKNRKVLIPGIDNRCDTNPELSVLSCRLSPILCMWCGVHRHHYKVGYGRPILCKCYFCQRFVGVPLVATCTSRKVAQNYEN